MKAKRYRVYIDDGMNGLNIDFDQDDEGAWCDAVEVEKEIDELKRAVLFYEGMIDEFMLRMGIKQEAIENLKRMAAPSIERKGDK